MKKLSIIEKINSGYKIVVCLEPTKKHDKVTLKTYLEKEGENIVFPIYYNHCKELLNDYQIQLIELFNELKNWAFRDKLQFNMDYKKDPDNLDLMGKHFVLQSINKIQYLEQR